MAVKLIWITPNAENQLLYCARVSNPNNQKNTDPRLLSYCIKHGHWSIFEMANLCIEIQTSRAISAQILRHRSFSFQEFSQRYSQITDCEYYEARRQDIKNRQNSIDDMSLEDKRWFLEAQETVISIADDLYEEALSKGIAKEQARFLLPLSTSTKLYMNGSVRSWIHYLKLRTDKSTQKEHRDIAEACKTIFIKELPNVAKALEWDR